MQSTCTYNGVCIMSRVGDLFTWFRGVKGEGSGGNGWRVQRGGVREGEGIRVVSKLTCSAKVKPS